MRKIVYIATAILLPFQLCIAQIGVNTENPQTILHIDALKNNTGLVPSAAQQRDDVYMGLGKRDEAVLSLGTIPTGNAQLEMNDANKGFYPNHVALTSQTDMTTVPNPVTGMLVWNTATVSGTNGVLPGLYVHENNKWQYLFTESTKLLQIRYLQTPFVSEICDSGEYDCSTTLDLGNDIVIPQTGAYGVGFNLYGKANTDPLVQTREIVYIWLLSNGVPVDVAELNPVSFPNGAQFTYTVFLGGYFNAGDKLTCRVSTYITTPIIYLYANPGQAASTFMMYWRIEQTSPV